VRTYSLLGDKFDRFDEGFELRFEDVEGSSLDVEPLHRNHQSEGA
jgi:hypothetical protein